MTEFVSSASRIAFAKEGTFGTKAAAFSGGSGGGSTPRFVGITNESLDFPDKDLDVKQYRSFGTGRKWFLNKPGRRERKGSLRFLPTSGEMFYFVYGQDTFTAGTPNTHVMSVARAATLPSVSMGVALEGSPNFLRVFTGCTFDNLNLSLSESGELSASMDYWAKDVQDEEQSAPTLFTQPTADAIGASPKPYMFYDRAANVTLMGTYDFTTNTISGGRTIARVKSFSMGVKNGLKPMYYTQSSNAQDPFNFLTSNATFDITMEIVPAGKLSGDTDALYDLLEGESKADILIPFQRAGTNDRFDIVLDNCVIKSAPHGLNADGAEVTVTVTVVPEDIQLVVRDTVATYSSL